MTNLTEPFINALLEQMTLNEKRGQLNQYNGGDRLDTDLIRQDKAVSLLNADGPLTRQGQSDSGSADLLQPQEFGTSHRL